MKIRTGFILLTICIVATFVVLITPFGIFKDTEIVSSPHQDYQSSNIVAIEQSIMQEFIPESEHLKAIQVMVDALGQNTGLFYFKLYDKDLNVIFETAERLRREDNQDCLFYRFPIDMELKMGMPYYYTLEYKDASFAVCYNNNAGLNHNGRLYYALNEIPNGSIISIYEYSKDYTISSAGIIVAIFAAIVTLIMSAFGIFLKVKNKIFKINFYDLFRVFLGFWTICLSAFCIYQVIFQRAISTEVVDIVVVTTGIIVCTLAILLSVYFFTWNDLKNSLLYMKNNIDYLLQSVFWGLSILACVKFVNAGSNYAQDLATKEMCIWLAAVMLVPYIIEIFKNKIVLFLTIIYFIASGMLTYFYIQPFRGTGEPYETTIRLLLMLIVWIYLLIRIVVQLIIKRPNVSWLYVGILVTFFICLLVFRHENIWEIAVVIPFGTLYLWNIMYTKQEYFLKTIGNGVILSYLIVSADALLHRPFHYYIYIRYSGVFTTVTVTSVYLALVFAVITAKLLAKYSKESSKLKNYWIEILLFGSVCAYQFLTLSRTGMMTCAGVYIIAIIIYETTVKGYRVVKLIQILVISCISIALSLPAIFTACRVIPALVDRPHIYEIEYFLDSIKQGEPIDSARYITVERFLGLSSERILGRTIAEDTIDNVEVPIINQENTLSESATASAVNTLSNNEARNDSEYGIDSPNNVNTYSNGRIDIFKNYIRHLNFSGHPAVGLTLEDGSTIIHAHNSFIQMAYDCGIPTGIIFIFLYIMFGFRTIKYYFCRYKSNQFALMPMLIFAAFGIASMVEYVFRPTIPLGFVFLAMFAPLLTQFEHHDKNTKRKV